VLFARGQPLIVIIFPLMVFLVVMQSPSLGDSLIILTALELVIYIALYTSFWYHVIMLLIILEFFILKGFFFTSLVIFRGSLETFFIFLFTALAVREASLGISLLTVLARAHGNDYLRIRTS
jgi:hypothetical protein